MGMQFNLGTRGYSVSRAQEGRVLGLGVLLMATKPRRQRICRRSAKRPVSAVAKSKSQLDPTTPDARPVVPGECNPEHNANAPVPLAVMTIVHRLHFVYMHEQEGSTP
jgi:hypothetical protein